MKDYLTTKEVQEMFGICKHTVMNWRNKNILPYIKINGRKFIYKKEDIEILLEGDNNVNK